jgi:5-methyltetrahydropteroyltriglutamate--homocysteine methyltransferase
MDTDLHINTYLTATHHRLRRHFGLVRSKFAKLESKDALKRRIDETAKVVPLEQLAISSQCGFSSSAEGNVISADDERKKLELCVSVARDVWGSVAN